MLPIDIIQNARRVIGSVRAMQFDESPLTDISDRIGLLTVVVGLRDVAAFGFGGRDNGRLTDLGKTIEGQGFHSLVTPFLRDQAINESLREVVGSVSEAFKRVDADSDAKNPGRLLWVCRNPAKFDEIRAVVDGKADVGILLGYPPCCVERHRNSLVRSQCAFAKAIVMAVGEDGAAVERALREDLQVHIPDEEQAFDTANLSRTYERFPFVFHVACDACLASDQSPTAEKNRDCEAAALQFDRAFHRLFLEMARIEAEIHVIVDDAEGRGLTPGQLEHPTHERLQKLFRDRARIHHRILNG